MNSYDDYDERDSDPMGYDPRTDSKEAETSLLYGSEKEHQVYVDNNAVDVKTDGEWVYEPAQHGGRDDPSWEAYYHLEGNIFYREYDEDGNPQEWKQASGDLAEKLELLWQEDIEHELNRY